MIKKVFAIFFLFLFFILPVCGIPSKIFISVPFTPQAPFGFWDKTYNEACEEASLIMVDSHFSEKKLLKDRARKEILSLVKFQEKMFGGHYDLTIKQTASLYSAYFKKNNFKIESDSTIDNILNELSKGHLIVAPMAGRLLGNPYFKKPGPVYHMIVIIGYDLFKKEFITNDPGTRRGKNYRYSFETIKKSLHDWTGNYKDISKGRPNILVFY